MKKNGCFFLILSLFLLSSLYARGAQELVKAGSWVYDSLASLFIECGYVDFTDQGPITVGEIRLYLDDIDYDMLSEPGKAQYNLIQDYFNDNGFSFNADAIQMGMRPEISLEGYYKNNKKIDWTYDRYDRHALLYVPVFINVKDSLSMGMDLIFGQNKCRMNHHDNYTNIPLAADQIDINFPDTGYLSTGFNFTPKTALNFQIGMGAQNVGRSLTGSIITSEYFTGASYANLGIYNDKVRYNMNVTQYNVNKYMYTHRFDFRFFKKLQLSVQESMLVYDESEPELRFLNPLTIFHGLSPWRDYGKSESNICAYLALKASFAPSKYFRIYGLYAQDQYQTPYEVETFKDDTTPNGIGGQIGIESYIPYNKGYFHVWAEGYYAQPYLYIKESPNWSMVRTYSENIGDMDPFYEWVGSPFGPDTISGQFNFGYEVPGKWAVTLSYLFMAKGELSGNNVFATLPWGGTNTDESKYVNAADWIYPDADSQGMAEAKRRQKLSSPSGTASYVQRVSVRGTFMPTDYVSITAQPAYVNIQNYNHQKGKTVHGFEFALSATVKLSKVFK